MSAPEAPAKGPRWPLIAAVIVLLGAPATAWFGPWRHAPEPAPHARGARLFDGTEALAGTLVGHAEAMPASTTRCVQCHAGPKPAPGALPSLGPPLDRAHLLQVLSRRGGPPTAYDLTAFCHALRRGIDPAHVILPAAMPRFAIDDTRCAALWDYLIQAPTP